jgi:hypothetical protein
MANKPQHSSYKSNESSPSKRSSYSVFNSLNPQNIARKLSLNSHHSRDSSISKELSLNHAANTKNIVRKTLPNFMRIANPSSAYRSFSPISEFQSTATHSGRYDSTSPSNALKRFDAPISRYFMPRKTPEPIRLRNSYGESPQSLGETLKLISVVADNGVISSVFDPTLDSSEVLARAGKLELTRNDLSSLREGQPLPRVVVDFYLKQLSGINRTLLSGKDPHDRVFIAKSSFSQGIFNSGSSAPHSKRNLFKFE